ncbi:MAG: GNAT family N-acetyltransferase, partial [Candidatus Eremiobacterota bacterium]
AVDEACAFVVQRAVQPEETFSVAFQPDGHGLSIRLRDRNLPVDPAALDGLQPDPENPATLGLVLMRAWMDEVRIFNRGRHGNEVLLVKRLKSRFDGRVRSAEPQPAACEPVEVRLVRAEEAVGVSRCLYQAYGYSYTGADNVYRPDWVREMNRQGRLISAVAVTGSGEVVGHAALVRMGDRPGIYEMGQGAVVPAYRGQGLLHRLVSFLVQEAQRRGFTKLYADPVTSHRFAQKAILAQGFVECALMLGAVPPEETHPDRVSLLVAVRTLSRRQSPPLYLPEGYREVLRETLQRAGLGRSHPEDPPPPLPRQGCLHWALQPASQRALVQVDRVGRNTPSVLGRLLAELTRRRTALTLVDLDLSDPHGPALIPFLRERGFFYCGLLAGLGRGDLLRMQRLQAEVDPDLIVVASPWGERLRELVVGDWRSTR